MLQTGQLLSSMLQKVAPASSKPIDLTPGQVFKGTVTKLYPDNMAQVQIGGVQIQAKLETKLEVGQKAWLQVQPTSNPITLKVLTSPDNPQELQDTSTEGLIRSLGITDNKESRALVEALLKQNMPITKEVVNAFLEVAKTQGSSQEAVDAFLLAMKRNLPLTKDVVGSLKAFLTGKPLSVAITQFVQEAEAFLQSQPEVDSARSESLGKTTAQPTADQAALRQLITKAVDKLSGLPIQLSDMPQSQPNRPALQPSNSATSAPFQPTPANGASQSQQLQVPLAGAQPGATGGLAFHSLSTISESSVQADSSVHFANQAVQTASSLLSDNTQSTSREESSIPLKPSISQQPSNSHELLSVEKPPATEKQPSFEKVPNADSPPNTVKTPNTGSPPNTEKLPDLDKPLNTEKPPAMDKKSDALGKNLPGRNMGEDLPGSSPTQEGSETISVKQAAAQPKSQAGQTLSPTFQMELQEPSLQHASGEQEIRNMGKVIYVAEGNDNQPGSGNATDNMAPTYRQKMNQNTSPATAAEEKPLVLRDLFQKLGLSHERQMASPRFGETIKGKEQFENIKTLLMQVSQASGSLPASLREAADTLLQQVTGQQLLLTQPNNQAITQIVMQIPLRTEQGDQTAFIQIESKKREGNQLDPDNCRLFFNLDLHSLGITMVDVNIVNKIVNINIYNDMPWVEELVGQEKGTFATQLRDSGYQLSLLKTQPIPEHKGKTSTALSAGNLGEAYKGVDLRI